MIPGGAIATEWRLCPGCEEAVPAPAGAAPDLLCAACGRGRHSDAAGRHERHRAALRRWRPVGDIGGGRYRGARPGGRAAGPEHP